MSPPRSTRLAPTSSRPMKSSKNNGGKISKPKTVETTVSIPLPKQNPVSESKELAKSAPTKKRNGQKEKSPPKPNEVTTTVSIPVAATTAAASPPKTTTRSPRKVMRKIKNAISKTFKMSSEKKASASAGARRPRKQGTPKEAPSPKPNAVTTTVSIPMEPAAQSSTKKVVPATKTVLVPKYVAETRKSASPSFASQVQAGPRPTFPPPPAAKEPSVTSTVSIPLTQPSLPTKIKPRAPTANLFPANQKVTKTILVPSSAKTIPAPPPLPPKRYPGTPMPTRWLPAAPMPPKTPSPIPPARKPFFPPPPPPTPKPLQPPRPTAPIPPRPEKPLVPRVLKNAGTNIASDEVAPPAAITIKTVVNNTESQDISGKATDNSERESIM